jgi:manganese/zinc/iron transport system permease protein
MLQLSKEDQRVWLLIGAVVMLALLFIPFSQIALDVRYTYTLRTVSLGGAFLGVVSGVLGCFAVLRHESLMGDALSHAALPGVGVGFLLAGRELSVLLIGAGVASWVGVQFIRAVLHTTRLKQDVAMGIVLAGWFAIGIAILTYIQSRPDASQAGLETFIFGQAATIVASDVQLIGGVGFIAFVVLGLFWKEFKLVTFDPEFAGANGFRIGAINTLLSTLIVVAIVLGLQLAGVILMVGMLIAPGIAARQWTQKLDQMVILAGIFGGFAGSTGAILSAIEANIPTGPMIIVVAFSIVVVSITLAPGRGLVWTSLRQRADRRRFAAQTTLRDLYRYAQSHGSDTYPVPDAFIRSVGSNFVGLGLKQLEKAGHIQPQDNAWILTPTGIQSATADAHNQQLWEIYREYGDELQLPLIMEDRQRDIHEVLPEPAIHKLEQKLEGASV